MPTLLAEAGFINPSNNNALCGWIIKLGWVNLVEELFDGVSKVIFVEFNVRFMDEIFNVYF